MIINVGDEIMVKFDMNSKRPTWIAPCIVLAILNDEKLKVLLMKPRKFKLGNRHVKNYVRYITLDRVIR